MNGFIIHLVELTFCYSACIKVMMTFLMSQPGRPYTEIIIGRATWQVTSVRALGSMMPSTMVVEQGGSVFMKDSTYMRGIEELQAASTAFIPTSTFAPDPNPTPTPT
ncbi:hypothetical protein EON65_59390, partial [archaeon]